MGKLCNLTLALFFACASAFAQTDGTFKVGVILPLTGPLTEYGIAAKNGIELARKEHPKLFRNIDITYDDSQYDMNRTVSAYRNLQSAHDVSLTFVWGSNPSNAVAAIAETSKTPLVAYSTERSVGESRNFVIRFCSHEGQHAQAILEYLRSKGLKHFGVFKAELVFFNGVVREMRKLLRDDETLSVNDVSVSESDFRTLLTKLRGDKTQALVVLLVSGQISSLYRQLDQLKVKIETVGTDFFDSMTEVRQAGGAMTGAVFPAHYVDQAFMQRYITAFGNELQLAIAAIAHDFALITGSNFGNGGGQALKAEDIVQKFKQAAGKRDGFATDFSFDPPVNGFDFRLIMRKIDKDRIVNLAE